MWRDKGAVARVCVTPQEREVLQRLVRSSSCSRRVRRAQALLWLDKGQDVGAVATRLGVTRQAVWHWVRRWKRPDRRESLEEALNDRQHPGRPATKRELATDRLLRCLSAAPAAFGYYGRRTWTVPLLHDLLSRTEVTEFSRATVRRALRGLGYRYRSGGFGLGGWMPRDVGSSR